MWYWITIPYACGGIRTAMYGGIVDETAPIFKWMYGREISVIKAWVVSKGGVIERLPN